MANEWTDIAAFVGKWTTAKPTKPGWYWTKWRTDAFHEAQIVFVDVGRKMMSDEETMVVSEMSSESSSEAEWYQWWLGPLPIPDEPKE